MNWELESKGCNSVAILIHAALFSYQKAYGRLAGDSSRAILSSAISYLIDLVDMAGLPEIRKEKSIDDNMSVYTSMLKESGYIGEALLRKKKDNIYSFGIVQCRFAFKGHRVCHGGLICPFAILAASIIYFKTDCPVSIDESRFTKTGSQTRIAVGEEITS
jgi:hypothetical protein